MISMRQLISDDVAILIPLTGNHGFTMSADTESLELSGATDPNIKSSSSMEISTSPIIASPAIVTPSVGSDNVPSIFPMSTTRPNTHLSNLRVSKPSITDADYTKHCSIDMEGMTPGDIQLARQLSSKLLDVDNNTCTQFFETGNALLQITFRVPWSEAPLHVQLVGDSLHCHEPFTIVYIDVAPTAVVMKRQCILQQDTKVGEDNGMVQCDFKCINQFHAQQDMNLTLAFQLLQWRSERHADARLCEIIFPSLELDNWWSYIEVNNAKIMILSLS